MDVDNLQGKGSPISISLPEIFIPLMTVEPESGRSMWHGMEKVQYEGPEKELSGIDDFFIGYSKTALRKDNKIDLEELIGRYDGLLVEGHPGSGKSTLFKHITYCLASGESVGGIENYLPVLIPLKDLKGYFDDVAGGVLSAVTVENILAHWIKIKVELISLETILAFCKEKKILFLMDGLDEIGQKERDLVADAFHLFNEKFPGIKIVFSGRPHGIKGEIIKKFGKHHVKIENLTLDQIEDFITPNVLLIAFVDGSLSCKIKAISATDVICKVFGLISAGGSLPSTTEAPLLPKKAQSP